MKPYLFFVTIIALTIQFPGAGSELEAGINTNSDTTRLRVIMSSDFPPIGVVKSGNVPNDQKSD